MANLHIFALFLASAINVALARTGRLSPENPVAIDNHNIEIKVIDVKPPIKSCQITLKNEKLHYNINNRSSFKDVHYLANESIGECGVLLSPAKPIHRGTWTFFVEDGDGMGRKFSAYLTVQVPPPEPTHKHLKKHIGSSIDEPCYLPRNNVLYVKIYNPQNELVQEGSSGLSTHLVIKSLKQEHNGTWKCAIQLKGRIMEVHNNIIVEVLPNETSHILKTETDTHVNLLYKPNIPPSSSPICLFERPDGSGIAPLEGVKLGRYSYYGSGIEKGECGISIEKPLEKHDNGFWKCILPARREGGFVYVHESSTEVGVRDIPVGTTTPIIKVLGNDKADIRCNAKESLSYCYAKSPEGVIHWGKNEGLHLGQCKIQVKFEMRDNGTWICGMGVEGYTTGYEDLKVPINVYVYEGPLTITKEPIMPAVIGQLTEIGFRSSLDTGLKYCLFIRPDGTYINVGSQPQNPYGKSPYTYTGQGLESGDCALTISPISEKDIGKWIGKAGLYTTLEYEVTITVSNVLPGK